MPAEVVRISVESGADQEEEALFSSASNTPSRCVPQYSVQSPSGSYYPCLGAITESCNSRDQEAASRGSYGGKMAPAAAAPTLIALSTYSSVSSSRESSNNAALSSFLLANKKTAVPPVPHVLYDVQSGPDDGDSTVSRLTSVSTGNRHGDRQRLVIVDRKGVRDGDEDDSYTSRDGIWRFLPVDPSAPWFCIAFQLAWRLLVSLGAALLVFYLVTKPPSPTVSVKMLKIHTFALREGLDNTGVVTNMLTCNCSVIIEIENHSKVFSLGIEPSWMVISYGHLTIVTKRGYEAHVNAGSNFKLYFYIATKEKPMYGAGSAMQDALKSVDGLQIGFSVQSRLIYSVFGKLVRPLFFERIYCNPVLRRPRREKRASLNYNNTCSTYIHH